MSEAILTLQHISKSFGDTPVLQDINLSIDKGEFITLLGSSGCGKTTTLRIIAGLESPDTGAVLLNQTDVTNAAPNKRDVNTVFQNYALFPHMSVAANIAYSLKLKKVPKATIKKEVEAALALVQLEEYGDRSPSELSGGQRQRVAIARALVNKPSVLLLDEPLGALDLQLRRQMQLELKRLQKKLGITFVYITHDQEEALNMSDRIAVMKDGNFEQIDAPSVIYNRPKTSYVAKFVGSANVVQATITAIEGEKLTLSLFGGHGYANACGHTFAVGQTISLAVRSEQLNLAPASQCTNGFVVTVVEKSFAGGLLRLALQTDDGSELIATRHGIDSDFAPGDKLCTGWDYAYATPVDVEAAPC